MYSPELQVKLRSRCCQVYHLQHNKSYRRRRAESETGAVVSKRTERQHVYSILNVLMKQNWSMPPYAVQVLELRLVQSKAASGTFVIWKFARHLPLPRGNWIVDWILGKPTKRASIQILNSVISKIRSYKYSKDRPETFCLNNKRPTAGSTSSKLFPLS